MGALSGKVALVTGASRGIGRATAERLAQEGAHVAVNFFRPADDHYRKTDAVEEAMAALSGHGTTVGAFEADVSSGDAVRQMVRDVADRFGGIDILVNNAGIGAVYDLPDISEEVWDRTLDVDLKGQFLVAQAVVPEMVRRGGGKIVNVASELGLVGEPGLIAYCAAKAGVIGFTKALAREVASLGILVNCVAPGPTLTDLVRPEESTPEAASKLPLGRLGQPQEIASAIYFLVSPDTTWTTGQVFSPNGGAVI
jgi:3-oxoacyl-[acyl-carrier protein] reductase